WFAEEAITPIEISYPVLWRNLTSFVAAILTALGQDPKLAPPPMLERQANQRSDEWVDRYREEAPALGLPTRAPRAPNLGDDEHAAEREDRRTVSPGRVGVVQ